MRFLFFDRIHAMRPADHAAGSRTVSIGDQFLPAHYTRQPIMPPSLVLESVSQLAGWLYIVTREFRITTVLCLVEGAEILCDARPGDTIELEAWMQYGHRDGATLRGVARINGVDVLRAPRLVFASRPLMVQARVDEARAMFKYLSGGFVLDGEAGP
jgi:3-hydroxyacyl-[acyl-carrier-protein] dehydratase